ncbi:MAG TPA: hypothetical protein VEZ11_12710 [Thermoanaerobaculia bacterium]|nr:hypothetical protein [Thermoanaerobaculia bacterium]
MKKTALVSSLTSFLVLGCISPMLAQPEQPASRRRPGAAERRDADRKEPEKGKESEKGKEKEPPHDQIVTTSHAMKIGGETIAYTARAGTIVIKDEDGNPQANIFFVSYTRDGADPAQRPITFAFNGGPGSSSVWLHMGAFGPKRVAYKTTRDTPPRRRTISSTMRIRSSTPPTSSSSIRLRPVSAAPFR